MSPVEHAKLANALTEYDRRESRKRHYNPYALAQYLAALNRVHQHAENGIPLRTAVVGCFTGRLADRLLKTLGLPLTSQAEAMRGVSLPELECEE